LYIQHKCKKKIFLPYHEELADDHGFCLVCNKDALHYEGGLSPASAKQKNGHFCSGLTDVSINLVGLDEVPNPETRQMKQKFERIALLPGRHIK
jgi:hypothetical protein